MNLLAIDAGTTHYKVGLFAGDGTALAITSRPAVTRPLRLAPGLSTGATCYDPTMLDLFDQVYQSGQIHSIALAR